GLLNRQFIHGFRRILAGQAFLVSGLFPRVGLGSFLQPVVLIKRDRFVGLLLLKKLHILAYVLEVFVGGDALAGVLLEFGKIGPHAVQMFILGARNRVP